MNLNTVAVPPRIIAGLRRHAASALPDECCGALIGTSVGACHEVRAMIPLASAEPAPDRYLIGADVVLRLERQAVRTGMHVLGFYHSHPSGGPEPSATDLDLAVPGYVYVIVAATGGELRAWKLRDDRRGFAELLLLHPVAGAA
jgi:desampylase